MKLTIALMSEPLASLIVDKASKIIALYLMKTARIRKTHHNMALIDGTYRKKKIKACDVKKAAIT